VKKSILIALEDIGKYQIVKEMEVFVKGREPEEGLHSLHSLLKKDAE